MKIKLLAAVLLFCLNANAQILFHDKAEVLPMVNYTTNNLPWKGYWTYTGGTQNTAAQSPDNNVTLSSEFAMNGQYSYKHYVKYTGNNNGQWGRGEWGNLDPGTQKMENAWYWTAISIVIDPKHAFESRRYQIAFDHKEAPDDQETPFYLAIVGFPNDGKNGARYALFGRFVGENDAYGRGFFDLGPVEPGKRVDWALNRNWETGTAGFMRFYKNGQLVWSMNGPNRDPRSGAAPICRMQHGFYKWAWYAGNPEGTGSGNTTGDLIMHTDNITFAGPNTTLAQIVALMNTGSVPDPSPIAPVVSAGPDFYVPFGTPGILRGTVTGTASSKKWTSSSTATFSAPGNDETTITTTVDGKFTAKLSAANGTAAASDDAIVNVVKANAGPDQTLDSGKAVTLTGTSTAGISITRQEWTRISGSGGTLSGNTVSGLPPGIHVFRYTVIYPSTLAVSDDVQITVKPGAPVVIPPPTKKKAKVEVASDLSVKIFYTDSTYTIH